MNGCEISAGEFVVLVCMYRKIIARGGLLGADANSHLISDANRLFSSTLDSPNRIKIYHTERAS